jgi:prevent-host-death family protein
MTTRVSVAEAKRHFADLLGRVAYGKERVLIMRRSKPMAVLVPPEELKGKMHLADARGWLEAGDSYFGRMDQIVAERSKHHPRTLNR